MADFASRLSRRQLITASGTGVLLLTSGCLGTSNGQAETPEEQTPPEPIDLSGGKQDDYGQMTIGEHYGPNGQIFYAEHSPEGHENPAWFHTLAASLFPYHFEREEREWTAVVIYVTDYSRVEYEVEQQGDETFISSHTEAETFERARDVRYVAGSAVLGGMGADLVPFSDDADLEAFREEYGGDVVEFSDITPEFIEEYP